MVHKEIKQLAKLLEEQGFDLWPNKKGHIMVYKDGEYVTSLPGTPSERRGFMNAVARARRAGFVYKGH